MYLFVKYSLFINMLTKQVITKKLKSVLDPELNISIVELGLIYDVKIKKADVEILMTLTTMGCPLFSLIEDEVKKAIRKISGVKKITVKLTFDPPWSAERMSKGARSALGI